MQAEVLEEESPDVTISEVTDILINSPLKVPQYDDQLEMSPPNTPFLQEGSSSTSSQETSFDASPVSHTHTVGPVRGALTDDNSFSGPSSASSQSETSGELTEDDTSSSPRKMFQDTTRCDSRGFPGWEAIDNLAEYLLSLNRTITALSTTELAEIMQLYSALHAMDKRPSKYTLKSKENIARTMESFPETQWLCTGSTGS
ncbi:uncharacterized protein LOC124864806 [Girardinichthys multiradiatus]|uniref:uncharacterized protein LOC124864806 n=1 Tax=Girardinichthys multiradiatus TaxID=208333 RepID=UPI001FAE2EE0|nr:uncharacterized protein LOC124864806 [Girardinichthys multiradiatus]